MNQIPLRQQTYNSTLPKRQFKRLFKLAIALTSLFAIFLVVQSRSGHAVSSSPTIKSGISGFCMDAHNSGVSAGTIIDSWNCNGTSAQIWSYNGTGISHSKNMCLSINNNGTKSGTGVVLSSCSNDPGQVWLQDINGFRNPNSGLCLSLPKSGTGKQLIISVCDTTHSDQQTWINSDKNNNISSSMCNLLNKVDKIACFASLEWHNWQSNKVSHLDILNKYTDNNAYEEWCADFVSYVYKESGYPFIGGETDKWDENNAQLIQNMGFTLHEPNSYMPKAGDVAFFDYNGGHVEIVIRGGKNPTFIYGNSATIDPTTNNGQMATNTKTHDGSEGRLLYYMSPN